jgi:hypothetical protein
VFPCGGIFHQIPPKSLYLAVNIQNFKEQREKLLKLENHNEDNERVIKNHLGKLGAIP